jgi:osmoprotectant transport system substrate-binding protein
MTSRRTSSTALAAAVLAIGFVATACGSSSSGASSGGNSSVSSGPAICGGKTGSGKLVIGSASFSENEILAEIYAAALKECGYDTSTKAFDSREVYYPALKKNKLQVVPEYAATLTDFINQAANGANAPTKASGEIDTTITNLKAELPSSLAVLTPSTATDTNSFAVTKAFATANNLTTMSDLAAYSKTHPLKLAGPPECTTRPYCEPGLKNTYGIKIASFQQTDAGGPLTVKAITSGKVNFGLVFSSDATVVAKGLVVLQDDKHLQASDNIVPLVASSLASGAAANALNAVDAKIDQTTLVALNKAVVVDHGQPADVASQFLSQNGLDK